MPDALRVFISYSRADSKDFADRLEQDLKAQQFAPWVDRHGLQGGQAWLEMIQQAIDECQALVVVLSPASVQSQYVHMEYHYAQEEGKHVIPVMSRAVKIPMDLRLLHCLDFQPGYEDGLRHLVQALSRLKPPESTYQDDNDMASDDNRDQWWAGDGRIALLKSALRNTTVLTLLNLTASQPTQWVSFEQVYQEAGRSPGQARVDLGELTMRIKQLFPNNTGGLWPLTFKKGPPLHYRMSEEIARRWSRS